MSAHRGHTRDAMPLTSSSQAGRRPNTLVATSLLGWPARCYSLMRVSQVPDELMTVAEVAAILKLNRQTVRNWIDAATLPAVRIGRRVRIKRPDFNVFIEAGYTSPRKPAAGIWEGDVPLSDSTE